MRTVEKWEVFELALRGHGQGNPFRDYSIRGSFWQDSDTAPVTVEGFYDGESIYRVRFMPDREGIYRYRVEGNCTDEVLEGSFQVMAPGNGNHGPVRVVDGQRLVYADNTPYISIGTTCYAWVYQTEDLQEQTLDTLKDSPFNKLRFCIFPKYFRYNRKEPFIYPFERGEGQGTDPALVERYQREHTLFPGQMEPEWDYGFDYYRPNIAYFQKLDLRIRQLRDIGIEADLILMHPYDRWGMNMMNQECVNLYLKYVNARFGAYRNVWWSLANEYDLIPTRSEEDWEHYGTYLKEKDPYEHLRSIHNCRKFYDYTRPWITHCSMQRVDFYRTVEDTEQYLHQYGKPVVWDEICYEGNIEFGWGNISAQELVRRFWEAFLRGGYAGHGETFLDENDILWWSHGGVLKGQSTPRLRFLLDILKEVPGGCLQKGAGLFDEVVGIPLEEAMGNIAGEGLACGYELHYLGIMQPAYRELYLSEEKQYEVEIIDTWNMTVTFAGVYSGITRIKLPGRPYMALRIRER